MTRSKLPTTATALAALCFIGLATSAQAANSRTPDKLATVPVLDMQPTCRAAASADLDLVDKPTFQSCMDSEQAGRQSLEKEWSGYTAEEKSNCAISTRVGGPPSYVNLLWCLRDAAAAKKLEGNASAGDGLLTQR